MINHIFFYIYKILMKALKIIPVAHSVQLIFKRWLVLFQHIPQRNCHMFPVFSFCTLQTHGCFTWLAVKLHDLQMVQWSTRQLVIIFLWVHLLINTFKLKYKFVFVYGWYCNIKLPLSSCLSSPCPHGWDRRGADRLWLHWLFQEHYRPRVGCTLGLAVTPPLGLW